MKRITVDVETLEEGDYGEPMNEYYGNPFSGMDNMRAYRMRLLRRNQFVNVATGEPRNPPLDLVTEYITDPYDKSRTICVMKVRKKRK